MTEIETLFSAKLAHAGMLAALYGNPSAKLEDGNEQVHKMYMRALHTVPYIQAVTESGDGGVTDLVNEWWRMNKDESAAEDGAGTGGQDG